VSNDQYAVKVEMSNGEVRSSTCWAQRMVSGQGYESSPSLQSRSKSSTLAWTSFTDHSTPAQR